MQETSSNINGSIASSKRRVKRITRKRVDLDGSVPANELQGQDTLDGEGLQSSSESEDRVVKIAEPELPVPEDSIDAIAYPDVFSFSTSNNNSGIMKRPSVKHIEQREADRSFTPDDVLTKLQNAVKIEERRNRELQKRIALVSDPNCELVLHDREVELLAQIAELQKRVSQLDQECKRNDFRQTKAVHSHRDNIEKQRLQIRALAQKHIAKRDQLLRLQQQVAEYEERWARFEQAVPLLHEQLDTGCEIPDAVHLQQYLKGLLAREKELGPELEAQREMQERQELELRRLKQLQETGEKAVVRQREVKEREIRQLQKEIAKLQAKKTEFLEEYETLYAEFKRISQQ